MNKTIGLLALLGWLGAAQAAYPDKPLTLILGYTPGGAADAVSRVIAQELGNELGQQVVVSNRPGGAGVLASDLVAKAAPDGYTLLLVSSANSVNNSIFTKLPYDPATAFAAVMQVTHEASYVMIVSPQSSIHTVADLVSYAKAQSGPISYASAGTGGGPHLAGALLASMAAVPMTHVPYKGGSPAMLDVMRGEVSFYFSSVPTALAQIRGGKVRAVAVSTAQRSTFLPGVPTVAESGMPGFSVSAWYGIVVPAKTPRAVVDKLNAALSKVVASPAVRSQLAEQGEQPAAAQTPEAFQRFMDAETKKYAKVVEIAGVQPQ
ncbi:tripartite tricarboxylate transporter substrate binding protein [Pigmentiphaga soli]|uniref:Tripartite tricarboxylate transporter substrate binding protein n=1 Tax=Pigmentiphaga soli TaxID=1007095 RepID=A0ABP8GF22_9BURK